MGQAEGRVAIFYFYKGQVVFVISWAFKQWINKS